MEEIIAYKCRCGTIHTSKNYIFNCKECGKEICVRCNCDFADEVCWECSNKKLKKENKQLCPYCKNEMIDNHYIKEGYGRIFGVTCTNCGYENWDK